MVRKPFKNLPEERVRLQILEFLLHEARWPAARIGCEAAVRDNAQTGNTLRADLVCYDRNFKPAILVECKAPDIRITGKTAYQIAGYNRTVKAPFLYLTNGVRDMFFKIDGETGNAVFADPAEMFPDIKEGSVSKPLNWFVERGFAGEKTSPPIKDWLTHALPEFGKLSSVETRYLDLGETPDGESIDNYYKIVNISDPKKLAIAFRATHLGETKINAVLNESGTNKGLLEINLELILKQLPYSAIHYYSKGTRKIDMADLFDFSTFTKDQIQELPRRINERLSEEK